MFKHRDNNKTQRKHGDGDGGGESGGTRLESNSPRPKAKVGGYEIRLNEKQCN